MLINGRDTVISGRNCAEDGLQRCLEGGRRVLILNMQVITSTMVVSGDKREPSTGKILGRFILRLECAKV